MLYCKLFLKTIYRNFCHGHIRTEINCVTLNIQSLQKPVDYAIPIKEGRKASLRQIRLFPPPSLVS
jgi:hypothetical protein